MKQIITSALYLLTIFAVSHFIFEPTYLYYELRWLDIPMHIMGGFGVASLVSAIATYRGRTVSFVQLFIAYSLVAFAWEAYEYAKDVLAYSAWNGWFDTLKDYINGIIGVGIAYLFIKK
jgi:hypothetical protein